MIIETKLNFDSIINNSNYIYLYIIFFEILETVNDFFDNLLLFYSVKTIKIDFESKYKKYFIFGNMN